MSFTGVLLFCIILLSSASAQSADFIKTSGTVFTLTDKPFFITGINNHYLTYGTDAEVTRVLDDAVALGANVVRTFLQPIIGSLDDSIPTIWDFASDSETSNLGVNGNYLLYWDDVHNKMAVNEGPTGMQKVDFLISEAKKRHLELIICFVDFWDFTGGAQQMRAWYGSLNKDKFFFDDPRPKRDYRKWVAYVTHRFNPLTGLHYRDDPTIMAWELANEPNARPDSLRHAWVKEMSAYVKTQDPNHLVASGHANNDLNSLDIADPSIDYETWHGYPLYMKATVSEFTDKITAFCNVAEIYQKPVLLEEFGYARSNPNQIEVYTRWLRTLATNPNCSGWLVWRLVSRQESGKYPDDTFDQFDVRNDGGLLWDAIKNATRIGKL